MRALAIGAIAAAGLLTATPAMAADRYASPDGTGPEATCPQSNPCNVDDAADGPSVADGDVVLLAAGTYTLTSRLDVTSDIVIRPQNPAGPKPVLTSAAPPDVVDVRTPGALLSDLVIRGTGDAAGLWLTGSTVERVVATSDGEGACHVTAEAVLRDSTCLDTGGAPGAMLDHFDSDATSATIVNVTAVSTGVGMQPYGIYVAANGGAGSTAQLTAHNVIAFGADGADVHAVRDAGATAATVTLSSSNYDNVVAMGGAVVTPTGSPGNQVAPPSFVNLPAGDLHQAPGSATIDAGTSTALPFGDLDIDRQPRVQGLAPDIGADEAPDVSAPDTSLTRTPKKKVKSKKKRKKARFAFGSSEPGSTFSCSLDGGAAEPCDAGTFIKKVKRGRHAFEVAATDSSGNTDPTPASYTWKLKRKRKR